MPNSSLYNYAIKIYDGLRNISYYKTNSLLNTFLVSYYETGNLIYSQEGTTSNNLSTSFIMPKNIKIGDSTALAVLYLYDTYTKKEYLYYRDSIKILYLITFNMLV